MFIKTRKTIRRFLRQVFKRSDEDLKEEAIEVKDDTIEVKDEVVKVKEEKPVKEDKPTPKKVAKEEPKKEVEKVVEEKTVKEVKEEPEKVVEAELTRSPTTPKYHVSYNRDQRSPNFGRWRVRRAGSRKTIKFFDTQLEAIDYAQHLADNNNTSIVIHKMDGSIRKQDYSK